MHHYLFSSLFNPPLYSSTNYICMVNSQINNVKGSYSEKVYYLLEEAPFCPTNVKVPAANHFSFASFTRCAAALLVISNPIVDEISQGN